MAMMGCGNYFINYILIYIMWKLHCDNQDYDCKLQNRPTLYIPEEQQEDGTWKIVGECKWEPLKVETNCPQWTGEKNVVLSLYNDQKKMESWTLVNTKWNQDSSLLFDGCEYLNLLVSKSLF